jgi:hypothetical protein
MPCHHNLDEYLVAYLVSACLRDDPKGPLFRTIGSRHRQADTHGAAAGERLCDEPPPRNAAGIAAKLGNHSFRATGITAHLKNGGTLQKAAAMANMPLHDLSRFANLPKDAPKFSRSTGAA